MLHNSMSKPSALRRYIQGNQTVKMYSQCVTRNKKVKLKIFRIFKEKNSLLDSLITEADS